MGLSGLRLAVVLTACDGAMSLEDLAEVTGLSTRTVRRHLPTLAAAGLAEADGEGGWVLTVRARAACGGGDEAAMQVRAGVRGVAWPWLAAVVAVREVVSGMARVAYRRRLLMVERTNVSRRRKSA